MDAHVDAGNVTERGKVILNFELAARLVHRTAVPQRMPRLIPRLLRSLAHARSLPPRRSRPPAARPTNAVAPSERMFTRPDEVDISPAGRKQSILLDPGALRTIYRHARYQRKKGPAPDVRLSQARWEAKRRRGQVPPGTTPRAMTLEERQFWANPYLRMLGSPLRTCFQTQWLLPRDLLIGMTSVLIPGERTKCTFLPSGIEHPAFRRPRGGKSHYLMCCKTVIEQVQKTGSYRRWRSDSAPDLSMHDLVTQQIGHELRVRVLQELQILARQLRRRPQPSAPPLLRRLTRAELNAIKSSGVVPFKNAVAILVVPPVNRDPDSKGRPEPNMTSMPTKEDLEPPHHTTQPFPLSVLYPTTKNTRLLAEDRLLPAARVPLYNGVPLFPSRTQRAALHAALGHVLSAERIARLRKDYSDSESQERDAGVPSDARDDDRKASHAVLVCSDEKTLFRGDTVPLAIALWRLRMWESSDDGENGMVDWIVSRPRTS